MESHVDITTSITFQRPDDASPGHDGLAGQVLRLQRGRHLPGDGLAARHHLQLQVLQDEGCRYLGLPLHSCRLLLHQHSPRFRLNLPDRIEITESFAEIINPVFFADPLGALVGKSLTSAGVCNPKWIGEKTLGLILS